MILTEKQFSAFEKRYSAKHGRDAFMQKIIKDYVGLLVFMPFIALFFVMFFILGIGFFVADFGQVFAYVSAFIMSELALVMTAQSLFRLPLYKRKAREYKIVLDEKP